MTDTTDLKARLRSSAKAFREHTVYDSEGDPLRLIVQANECDEAADALDAKDRTIERLQAEVERLSDILDTERYRVAIGAQAIRKAVDGRRWLGEGGRGFYTYDDERYQQEFGAALDEIAAALEPLRKIASDWSDCPTDPLRVAENRSTALKGQTP